MTISMILLIAAELNLGVLIGDLSGNKKYRLFIKTKKRLLLMFIPGSVIFIGLYYIIKYFYKEYKTLD